MCLAAAYASNTIRPDRDTIEVFYININASYDRRLAMNMHLEGLGYSYHRVEGVNTRAIPFNITRATACPIKTNSSIDIPCDFLGYRTLRVKRMCLRTKNTMKEIGCTLSHLVAMFTAISSKHPSKYALLLEDDMRLGMNVDFNKFVAALPHDFGVVQMLTSNLPMIEPLLDKYRRTGALVVPRGERDYWCTGGFLINKEVLRKQLERTLIEQTSSDVFELELIAGYKRPCSPSYCCSGNTFSFQFPCVMARRGVSADNYLYNIAFGKSYVTTLPLIRGSSHGNVSTIHQSLVQWTSIALQRVDEILAMVSRGELPAPSYLLQ